MKKILLSSCLALSGTNVFAQVVTDTVSLGPQYANQVWYSLQDDEKATQPKGNWDIAFQTYSGMTASILVNNFAGSANPQTSVWVYPKGDISAWGTAIDTVGLSSWSKLYNSESAWSEGAFGLLNGLDLGWGIYDMNTHYIMGDSLYIIKTIGGSYKQLIIEKLASGTYTFKYADLNGANSQTHTLAKANYAAKSFGYFSIDNNSALNREPDTSSWDLLFCQYQSSDYAPGTMQGVGGVLHHRGLMVAEVQVDPISVATYSNYTSHTFNPEINAIGWDWKKLNSSFQYDIKDSSVYFVQQRNNDIWKLVFKGFGGSANGNFVFTKEKIYTAPSLSVNQLNRQHVSAVVYPNPSTAGNITLLYSFDEPVAHAMVEIADIKGRMLLSESLNTTNGLQQYVITPGMLPVGTYIVSIVTDRGQMQQKLIVQ